MTKEQKPASPSVGDALKDALKLCVERDRPDLLAELLDGMILILRYPNERFPDGPPREAVERMRRAREARYSQ